MIGKWPLRLLPPAEKLLGQWTLHHVDGDHVDHVDHVAFGDDGDYVDHVDHDAFVDGDDGDYVDHHVDSDGDVGDFLHFFCVFSLLCISISCIALSSYIVKVG